RRLSQTPVAEAVPDGADGLPVLDRSPDSGIASHASLDSHLRARAALVAGLRRHPAPVAAAWARRRRSDAMTPSAFESELRLDGEVVVLALRGELDLAS